MVEDPQTWRVGSARASKDAFRDRQAVSCHSTGRDSRRFATYVELAQQHQQERQEKEKEKQEKEKEKQRAEVARLPEPAGRVLEPEA